MTSSFLPKKVITSSPDCQVLDQRPPLKIPWADLSPLVQEALKLGCEIRDLVQVNRKVTDHKRARLPKGHRYYQDEVNESETRVLSWLISKHLKNSWFVSLTFEKYIEPEASLTLKWQRRYDGVKPSANRVLAMWLSRLNQAYKEIPGAALLKSVVATEWQQRGVVHFHLLIYGSKLGVLSRKRWEHRWRIIGGGFATIYDAENEAASYLAKHQVKNRPGGNLELGGAWRGINPPRSLDVNRRSFEKLLGCGESFLPCRHNYCPGE